MEKKIHRMFLLVDENGKTAFIGKPDDFILLGRWLFLAAAFAGVDLGLAVRTKYPGLCPYCMQKRCQCGPVKTNNHKRWEGPIPEEGTISNLQQMIAEIYPPERHTLERHREKMLEEIEECKKEIRRSALLEISEELADIFAWLCPMAKMLNMPLSE